MTNSIIKLKKLAINLLAAGIWLAGCKQLLAEQKRKKVKTISCD